MTQEELFGDNVRSLTSRLWNRILEIEIDVHLSINMDGRKEAFGFYLSEKGCAKFWMSVLNDLMNRDVEEIFIACMDELSSVPDTVRAVYLKTRIQLCIVHMVRNNTNYVSYKD